jgi:hypothetical protein
MQGVLSHFFLPMRIIWENNLKIKVSLVSSLPNNYIRIISRRFVPRDVCTSVCVHICRCVFLPSGMKVEVRLISGAVTPANLATNTDAGIPGT